MISREEILELFEDCQNIDKKYDDARDYSVLHQHQIGSGPAQSIAWKLFRCRADENKSIRFNRFCKAIQMLGSGLYSMREISRETTYSINTITKLMGKLRAKREREGDGEIKCPCGTPIIIHRGWCSYRVSNSEARQDFLKTFGRNYIPSLPINQIIVGADD